GAHAGRAPECATGIAIAAADAPQRSIAGANLGSGRSARAVERLRNKRCAAPAGRAQDPVAALGQKKLSSSGDRAGNSTSNRCRLTKYASQATAKNSSMEVAP